MDIKQILGGVNPYVQSKVDKGEAGSSASKTDSTKGKSAVVSGDTVSLSDNAKLVAQAASNAQVSPDVRVDRVQALKAQVQAGTYNPDSQKIAEKLVDSDMDFLR
jgi:negative regulator of flagellin synthesis FlgM